MTFYRYQIFPWELTHGSLREASCASVKGMDSETQFFWHPWPSRLGPDLVSAASQVSFPVLFCFSSGASEPGLSQPTHFSFAAETGGWVFSLPVLEKGPTVLWVTGTTLWTFCPAYLGIFEAIKTALLLPWNPQRPQKVSHDFLVWSILGIEDMTASFTCPGGLEAKNRMILRPGPFIAFNKWGYIHSQA